MLRLTFLYFSRKGSGAGVVVVRDIKEVWTSLTSRGQNLVNSKDLSSNSPSGATLGLISEVLKVRFYGVCHVQRSLCFTYSFHYTDANFTDNGEANAS